MAHAVHVAETSKGADVACEVHASVLVCFCMRVSVHFCVHASVSVYFCVHVCQCIFVFLHASVSVYFCVHAFVARAPAVIVIDQNSGRMHMSVFAHAHVRVLLNAPKRGSVVLCSSGALEPRSRA